MTDHHDFNDTSLTEMFVFETSELIHQLEISILNIEKSNMYTIEWINEIFRAMHTMKGSSSVMMLTGVAAVSHAIEDLFYFIRQELPQHVNLPVLSDLIFEGIDFIKVELHKFQNGEATDGNPGDLIQRINDYLQILKAPNAQAPDEPISSSSHRVVLFFNEDCDMVNIRSFTVVHKLAELATDIQHQPVNLMDDEVSVDFILKHGLTIQFNSSKSHDELYMFFMGTAFMKSFDLQQPISLASSKAAAAPISSPALQEPEGKESAHASNSIINVNVAKMDSLMDLVGELVIAEAMVTQNPELKGLELDNFHKAARQLRKITSELQDSVMSIRMVPLAQTFHKMHRIVRDMCKKLDKDVRLNIIGEETGVDKNIIEHISDPLMHLVRNAVDHGIESAEERKHSGKPEFGTVTLEARNEGGDVLVIIKDDGKGLNVEKLLDRAKANGLLRKEAEAMTDKEVYQLIFLPGFSTKDSVTEFSGRGVGMDVVAKNIESIGGIVSVDSVLGRGTTLIIKIPLTLAIIDGMNIRVGASSYTLPTVSIKQSFRAHDSDIISDPSGNEMIMVRGHIYPILRLYELYGVQTKVRQLSEGILIMVEHADKCFCIFADELLGQQQVVVKALPPALQHFEKVEGLAGCTLLGDGSISLILDVGGLYRTCIT